MHSKNWQERVVAALREDIGPLAPVLVGQVIANGRIDPNSDRIENITEFLKLLREELPSCINASSFILEMNRRLVLQR